MDKAAWFDVPVIGSLSPQEIATMLPEIAEEADEDETEDVRWKVSQETKALGGKYLPKWWEQLHNKPWMHTNHVFGYLAPNQSGSAPLQILPLQAIPTTPDLSNTSVKITLNRFRVADYPGGGTHQILAHFSVKNQAVATTEELHFNTVYRIRQHQHAAIQGYPIFIGLQVGTEGIIFRCRTINVKNEQDEAFLGFLESNTFKGGLHLLSTTQPALVPFSEMAFGLAKAIASRHRNISVQDFTLGLDFGTVAGGVRLAVGAYLAVQVPDPTKWNWDEWVYHPGSSSLVQRSDLQQPAPYNYLLFGIDRLQ